MHTLGSGCASSIKTKLIHQRIEDLRNRTKPRSRETDRVISQLRKGGIEILNSQLNRQNVFVWIWCRTQAALDQIQKLYESNKLKHLLSEIIQSSISMLIKIDRNLFKKTIAVRPISISLTQRIETQGNKAVWGVTELRNEINVLVKSSRRLHSIRVFENETPFRFRMEIEIKAIVYPWDIGSNEKQNCLYICDQKKKCVWKIANEENNDYYNAHKIVKWLTTDFEPGTLSVSRDGQLLMPRDSLPTLMIYGPDAKLIRLIYLPLDIRPIRHAAETSIGTLILIHGKGEFEELTEEGKQKERFEGKEVQSWTDRRNREMKFVVSEFSADGQFLRRFIPLNETQELKSPEYISLDPDDRVFVADTGNNRVVLLDSDLKWVQVSAKEEPIETKNRGLWRLCYDEEMKQLIAGGYLGNEVSVYTLNL